MNLKLKCAIMFVSLFASVAVAESLPGRVFNISAQANDKLVVKGFDGQVKVMPAKDKGKVTVKVFKSLASGAPDFAKDLFDDWSFQLSRSGGVISAEISGPTSKTDWSRYLIEGGVPKYRLEIMIPKKVNFEVYWRDGKITLGSWQGEAKLRLKKGEVTAVGGDGKIDAYVGEGDVNISNCKCSVKLDSYNAKIKLQHVQGEIKLENFVGSSWVHKSEGSIYLSSSRGKSKVTDSKGNLEFENRRASISVRGFNGPLRGKSGLGSISVTSSGKADIRLRTKEGPVSLRLPKSGATINLGSKEGNFYVPSYLKLTRYPSIKVMNGRLRGSSNGRVFVRTESGSIKLK